jgi:argininosuccinate lyase
MKALPLAYNKDMQEDKECFFDTVNTLLACLKIITPFIESVKFNTDVMHEAAVSGYLDATEILELLVKKGVSFRDAHHQVGKWVAEAEEKNISVRELIDNSEI